MPTEKQIAANRANGRRSRGPASVAGKTRASRNSYRHGLTRPDSTANFLAKAEKLARRFAGQTQSGIVRALARDAAEAVLELARVRRIKVALIERVNAFGGLVPPKHFYSNMQQVRWCQAMDRWLTGLRRSAPAQPMVADPLLSMPLEEPHRQAEAVRRVLAELLKLDRYERRAASRKNRAIGEMTRAKAKSQTS